MLGPEERIPDLLPYIEQELYFVVHAARQTGKSTAMIAFAQRLREAGYAGVYITLEQAQQFTAVADAEPLWLAFIEDAARRQLPDDQQPPPVATAA
jgi:deoxyribodipyrimidine photolyase-like uncharacterized protein